MKRVLIIDDTVAANHPIQNILEKCGFEVIGQAGDIRKTVKLYQELRPDMVTIDVSAAAKGGLAALQQIKEIDPNARIIVVSQSGQERQVREAMTAGAVAFIIKPDPIAPFTSAIQEEQNG